MTTISDLLEEFKESPTVGDDLPVLTLTERNGFVRQSERFSKRLATNDVSGYKVVRRNDVAFNPYLLWAGAVAQNTIVEAGIISPLYPTFRVRQGFDPSFVSRLLLSDRLVAAYDTIAFGSVPRRRRSAVRDFLSLPVSVPLDFEEQRRIAAILDKADALRAKRRQALAHLDSLPPAIFHEMFGAPGSWADQWPMGVIGDMVESSQYGTSSRAGDDGAWPILRMGNVTDDGRLDASDLKYIDLGAAEVEKYTVRRGDLLFNRTNSKEKVGKACVIRNDSEFAFAGYLIRVRLRPEHEPEFVSAYLRSGHGKAVRRRLAKAAVNQANINAREMQAIPIAMPPTGIQREFGRLVREVEARRSRAVDALEASDSLFVSLQYRAFRGEL